MSWRGDRHRLFQTSELENNIHTYIREAFDSLYTRGDVFTVDDGYLFCFVLVILCTFVMWLNKLIMHHFMWESVWILVSIWHLQRDRLTGRVFVKATEFKDFIMVHQWHLTYMRKIRKNCTLNGSCARLVLIKEKFILQDSDQRGLLGVG